MWLFITFYVLFHDPSGDRMVEYDGMPQSTVDKLVTETNIPFEYVSSDTFKTFNATHTRNPG